MKGGNINTFAKIPLCVKGLVLLYKLFVMGLFSSILPVLRSQILKVWNLFLAQVGDGGFFLQGNGGQDITDGLVCVEPVGHRFPAGRIQFSASVNLSSIMKIPHRILPVADIPTVITHRTPPYDSVVFRIEICFDNARCKVSDRGGGGNGLGILGAE